MIQADLVTAQNQVYQDLPLHVERAADPSLILIRLGADNLYLTQPAARDLARAINKANGRVHRGEHAKRKEI